MIYTVLEIMRLVSYVIIVVSAGYYLVVIDSKWKLFRPYVITVSLYFLQSLIVVLMKIYGINEYLIANIVAFGYTPTVVAISISLLLSVLRQPK